MLFFAVSDCQFLIYDHLLILAKPHTHKVRRTPHQTRRFILFYFLLSLLLQSLNMHQILFSFLRLLVLILLYLHILLLLLLLTVITITILICILFMMSTSFLHKTTRKMRQHQHFRIHLHCVQRRHLGRRMSARHRLFFVFLIVRTFMDKQIALLRHFKTRATVTAILHDTHFISHHFLSHHILAENERTILQRDILAILQHSKQSAFGAERSRFGRV
mmetsp:Transcript_53795/g.86048  ORF Transcript_53795/g.86048 Transcript_53795/m.86048 type:complete len:218 (-) Transcript_53795:861-1514(-)